jgi:N-acetylglucosaminyl-diphospho-decaprenol L-rhamnosyltransferase
MEENEARDLSVVIVSWNTRELLTRCLASLLADAAASGITLDVIVIDNASADGSAAALAQHFPSITVEALEANTGFAAATNRGIRRASGGDILLLNPDTELLPGALAALRRALHSMPHAGLVGGLLLNPDGSLQSSGYRFPHLAQTFLDFFPLHPRLVGSQLNGRVPHGDGLSPYAVDHPLGACMLVRREVVERVGLLDECFFMYSEEIDWCRRIVAAGWTVLIAPAARIIHFGGQSTSQASDAMFLQLHRSRARYFRRYHSGTFLHSVELMARAAAWWAGSRSSIEGRRSEPTRAKALRSVSRIYREARGDDA